ncbi:MAG TPA: hypothetical protein VF188_09225 [Longimicrobiales bacterium]
MTRWKAGLIAAAALVIGFAVGFGWQYIRAERLESALTQTRDELTFQRLAITLGAATLEAQTGDYEAARQKASDFFTGLQHNIERTPESARPAMSDILAERDSTITVLSRGAPQSKDVLGEIFTRYRLAWEPEQPAAPPVQPATTTTTGQQP